MYCRCHEGSALNCRQHSSNHLEVFFSGDADKCFCFFINLCYRSFFRDTLFPPAIKRTPSSLQTSGFFMLLFSSALWRRPASHIFLVPHSPQLSGMMIGLAFSFAFPLAFLFRMLSFFCFRFSLSLTLTKLS
jgi:hypothetical protein